MMSGYAGQVAVGELLARAVASGARVLIPALWADLDAPDMAIQGSSIPL